MRGIGEVRPGDDLAQLIVETGVEIQDFDCLIITQKVVSKAEGRLVSVAKDSGEARSLVEGESVRILRRRGDLVISETAHGFVCANAGVDFSNVPNGQAALLPLDSDRSATRIRHKLKQLMGVEVAVVISDTFGRPWRRGLTDVTIGCSGIAAIIDMRGTSDAYGRELHATQVAIVDEIAGAADLVMGKDSGIAVAIVRGLNPRWFQAGNVGADIVRPPSEDLFR